jgi:hypothetical protein
VKKLPASSNDDIQNGRVAADPLASSLPPTDGGQVPQPQPQDLDGATLAPCAASIFKEDIDDLNASAASVLSVVASNTTTAVLALSPLATPSAAVDMASGLSRDAGAHVQGECRLEQGRTFVSPSVAIEEDNRDYSPVMDQLDETMVLLQSMQVAARAASDVRTPQPLSLSTNQDKGPISSPAVSLSAHSAQKEAWLAGYSSGLAHAHAQALCHIEELGNIQSHVAAQRDAVDELRSKHENLASQLSFLQGTCTQAFTGIWKALGRNTIMIEERLQVEASLQSRLDGTDARVTVHSVELQQQSHAIASMRQPRPSWWRDLQCRAPALPSHLLLQLVVANAALELLLRYSPVVLGRRFRLGRNRVRKINALVAVLSLLRLLLRASHVLFPALHNAWVLLRGLTRPFAALGAAAEKGNELAVAGIFSHLTQLTVHDMVAAFGSD